MSADAATTVVGRPVLRYHGGKWRLAPWLIAHFPAHRTYVEPFGGGGSVLLRKPRSNGEVYNDLDGDVVNVFRVLKDPSKARELERLCHLTPFARSEFDATYHEYRSDVERAWATITRSFMGFGSAACRRSHKTGFRSNSNRSGTTPAQDWRGWPSHVAEFVERLRGVVIENRDASDVIRQHDGPETLHYVDPPYPHETRSSLKNKNGNRNHYYQHELSDDDHRGLADLLNSLDGMVIISSYPSELYSELFTGWRMIERHHMADGARQRTEVIWMNRAAAEASIQQPLFAEHS